jgi:hypothetical protein
VFGSDGELRLRDELRGRFVVHAGDPTPTLRGALFATSAPSGVATLGRSYPRDAGTLSNMLGFRATPDTPHPLAGRPGPSQRAGLRPGAGCSTLLPGTALVGHA